MLLIAEARAGEAEAAQVEIAELKNSIQASQLAQASRAELSENQELGLLLATTALGRSSHPDALATFYSAASKPFRASLDGRSDAEILAVFSPDGTQIVTASCDGSAKVWDLEGNELASLDGHTDLVNLAVFSPDGTRILTASADGSAKIWEWFSTIESMVEVARTRLGERTLTDDECRQFFADDLASCPQTREALFALFDDDLEQ